LNKPRVDLSISEEKLLKFRIRHEQKLKSAVWLQMDFLSEVILIDDPSEITDLILDSMEGYYFDFPSIDDYFARRKNHIIEDDLNEAIDEFDKKLESAVRKQMVFLYNFLGISDFEKIMLLIDDLVNVSIFEYLPRREQF
jgi:hypothetical protein